MERREKNNEVKKEKLLWCMGKRENKIIDKKT